MDAHLDQKPKAYSYLRFSRPEQAKGDSLRRQLERAHKYASEHNLDLDDSLRDKGVSAFRSKNRDDKSALGSFLLQAESGRVAKGSYLLVESLDRLSRDQVPIALKLFLGILELGIIIVTLADNRRFSYESISAMPSDLIVSIAMMMRSNDESAIKSSRIRAMWEKKRANAVKTRQAMTPICPGWVEMKQGHFVEIDKHADIVRRIFAMCIDGVGTRTIAKRFNLEGVPQWGRGKKRGRMWHDSYIKKILENPAVFGEFTPRSKLAGGSDADACIPIQGYYPAVVDKPTFYKARAILQARATSSVRSPAGKHRNVISGLVKCANCGGGMHYIDKGKKGGRPYLQCGSSLLRGGCDHNSKHTYETIETKIVMNCSESVNEDVNDRAVNIRAAESALSDILVRLERIADAIEESGISDTLRGRLKALERDRRVAEVALSKANQAANRRDIARSFRMSMKEAAEVAMRLRNAPDDVQLRAQTANMLRNVLHQVNISPSRLYLQFADGAKVDMNLPTEEEVIKFADRWIRGPMPLAHHETKPRVLPPLFTAEEIAALDEELRQLGVTE